MNFKILFPIFFALFLFSCNRPPENYNKANLFFQVQKYDSALYYYDLILPDKENWFDSSLVKKRMCIDAMTQAHFWDMLDNSLVKYKYDTSLINNGNKALYLELKKMIDNDSLQEFYHFMDNCRYTSFTDVSLDALEYFQNKLLVNDEWEGTKEMKGNLIKFEKGPKSHEGNSSKTKNYLIGKCVKTYGGWTKDKVLYRNINYDTLGTFNLEPRIWRNEWFYYSEYFGNNGTLVFITADTLKIDYGPSVDDRIIYFARKSKTKNTKT